MSERREAEVEKAVQRVRDAKAAISVAEAAAKGAHEAADAAARRLEVARRERLGAENALLALVNDEPRVLVEPDPD